MQVTVTQEEIWDIQQMFFIFPTKVLHMHF